MYHGDVCSNAGRHHPPASHHTSLRATACRHTHKFIQTCMCIHHSVNKYNLPHVCLAPSLPNSLPWHRRTSSVEQRVYKTLFRTVVALDLVWHSDSLSPFLVHPLAYLNTSKKGRKIRVFEV